MEAFELRAYETLGHWTIILVRVWEPVPGQIERSLVYRGDHVPIDDEDTTVRAALLLHQVYTDLDWALSHDPHSGVVSNYPVGH